MRVLIVDRDEQTAVFVEQILMSNDLRIEQATSGLKARRIAESFAPHLIILEVDLDDMNGIELCSDLREVLGYSCSIVFYSAKEEEFIQVLALDRGADDYIMKHRRPHYMRSKLNAILRKNFRPVEDDKIMLDTVSRVIKKNGKNIYLSKKEFDIVQLLTSKPNQIFKRTEILEALWNRPEERTRMLDVHISHLRDKLGEDLIKTVKGIGYGFIGRI